MASNPLFSLPLLLLLLTLFPSQQPHLFASADLKLIHKTCKNTNYYNLCVSSLKSNSSSFKAADTRDLAVIMVGIGISNATNTYSYLSSQLLSNPNNDSSTLAGKQVLQECAEKYSYASDALKGSLPDLVSTSFDYAFLQVNAAKEYANGCRIAYRRFPALAYPVEMARREEGLEHICDIILAMINLLIV